MQSPFSRVRDLTAKQVVSQDKKQHNEQDGQQGTAQKEGQQHPYCYPEQNKTEHFSHGNPSIILNYYRICGIFSGVHGFFEK